MPAPIESGLRLNSGWCTIADQTQVLAEDQNEEVLAEDQNEVSTDAQPDEEGNRRSRWLIPAIIGALLLLALLFGGLWFGRKFLNPIPAPTEAPVEITPEPTPTPLPGSNDTLTGLDQIIVGQDGQAKVVVQVVDPKATSSTITLSGGDVLVWARNHTGDPLNVSQSGNIWTVSSKNGYWLGKTVELIVESTDGSYVGAPYSHAGEVANLATSGINGASSIYAPGVYAPIAQDGTLGYHGNQCLTYTVDNPNAPSGTFGAENANVALATDAFGYEMTMSGDTVTTSHGLGMGGRVVICLEGSDPSRPFAGPH